ncbi:MAG: type II toxin-antitoxin system PemK/MazF family toxin [Ignavibacteriales bacterium]|nr:type II toxin-antitoxin system PemK/MazF family toxin [Ignavibacteriales bacterium]
MNRGDIVLMTFPFSDLSTTKVRPALVLSSFNSNEQDMIVALISSNTRRELLSSDFLLNQTHIDFSKTGLKSESVFRMSKLHNLNKSLAKRRIGKVSDLFMNELEMKLRIALGVK